MPSERLLHAGSDEDVAVAQTTLDTGGVEHGVDDSTGHDVDGYGADGTERVAELGLAGADREDHVAVTRDVHGTQLAGVAAISRLKVLRVCAAATMMPFWNTTTRYPCRFDTVGDEGAAGAGPGGALLDRAGSGV